MSGVNRAPLTGMAAFVIVLVSGLVLTHETIPSLLFAGGLGTGIGLIVQGIFPYKSDLEGYRLDAQRRVRKLLKMLGTVERIARSITHEPSQRALRRGSELVRDVIVETQKKDPNSVASTAASLTGFVVSVQNVATTYLTLQEDPDIPGAREMMAQGQEGFANFEQYAVSRKAQAQRGDILKMKADLESMKPLPNLSIPEGGVQ